MSGRRSSNGRWRWRCAAVLFVTVGWSAGAVPVAVSSPSGGQTVQAAQQSQQQLGEMQRQTAAWHWLVALLAISLGGLACVGGLALRLRRSQASLARERAILRSVLDSMVEGVVVIDRRGEILLANPASERLAGVVPAPGVDGGWIKGNCDCRLDAATPCPKEQWPLRRALRGESCDNVELLVPASGGRPESWLSVTVRPLAGATGVPRGGVIVFSDVTARKIAEAERLELQELQRDLEFRREAAREEERRHIAREMHDELGQHLSALRMELSLLRMRWGVADMELMDKAKALQASVDHVIRVVRNLVASLRPAVLDMGIASALEWLAAEFYSSSKVPCRLDLDERAVQLDANQTNLVFRLVQESLTNVSRHAHASEVRISLTRRLDAYLLTIRDDGLGFEPSRRAPKSFGLLGMRERAEMLGGELDIRTEPGRGTLIAVSFPAEEVAAAVGRAAAADLPA